MAKATHKPPARIRYEQSHPTVSCRLDKDTHDLLKQRLEALGRLQLKKSDLEELHGRAWIEGFTDATEKWGIWYYCAVCGKRIDMSPNGDDHKAMIGYMKEHRWAHAGCQRQ
jgi:hypothetical protein